MLIACGYESLETLDTFFINPYPVSFVGVAMTGRSCILGCIHTEMNLVYRKMPGIRRSVLRALSYQIPVQCSLNSLLEK